MRVTLFPCGTAANQSEIKAAKHLENMLRSTQGNDEWVPTWNSSGRSQALDRAMD